MMLVLAFVVFSVSFAAASPRHLYTLTPSGTRTESAIKARQLTRERLMGRAEKLTMASLFGREDCAIPEPSTMACTCGPEYVLCSGNLCRNLQTNLDHCGDCDDPCPVGPLMPACCGGGCVDLSEDNTNCGTCGSHCDAGINEFCCSGGCRDVKINPEHCGACHNPCDIVNGDVCCDGACRPTGSLDFDKLNCGSCGHVCPGSQICCNGHCTNTDTDSNNCGMCSNECTPGFICIGAICILD